MSELRCADEASMDVSVDKGKLPDENCRKSNIFSTAEGTQGFFLTILPEIGEAQALLLFRVTTCEPRRPPNGGEKTCPFMQGACQARLGARTKSPAVNLTPYDHNYCIGSVGQFNTSPISS